jgi:hypothetical protein
MLMEDVIVNKDAVITIAMRMTLGMKNKRRLASGCFHFTLTFGFQLSLVCMGHVRLIFMSERVAPPCQRCGWNQRGLERSSREVVVTLPKCGRGRREIVHQEVGQDGVRGRNRLHR